jgi:multicomponent Na+:H+ antiporter subunit G
MAVLWDILSGVLLAAGSFFIIVGAIGLVRLPDMFARMHGAGVTDTLGAGLFIAGLMIQGGFTLITVKLFMILVFFFFASPTSSYALANAALSQGEKPWTRDDHDTHDDEEDTSSKT